MVEYRKHGDQTVLTLQRNVSMTSEGRLEWAVPAVEMIPVDSASHRFTGDLVIWGFEQRSQRIVFGRTPNILLDYTDAIPRMPDAIDIFIFTFLVTLRFQDLSADIHWKEYAMETVIMSLETEAGQKEQRHAFVTLQLFNERNELVAVVADRLEVAPNQWPFVYKYTVPKMPKLQSYVCYILATN